MKTELERQELTAWVVAFRFDDSWKHLGIFCWPAGDQVRDNPMVLFATRRAARNAIKRMTSYRTKARAIRVRVTIEAHESKGKKDD